MRLRSFTGDDDHVHSYYHIYCPSNGDVTVRWKGSLTKSMFYDVYRWLNNAGTFTLVGSVAAKQFVDSTIPSGCQCAS